MDLLMPSRPVCSGLIIKVAPFLDANVTGKDEEATCCPLHLCLVDDATNALCFSLIKE